MTTGTLFNGNGWFKIITLQGVPTCGLGVRVVAGERTCYAYTDNLSWPAMARAAETAAHIASDSKALPPQPVSPAPVDRRYGETSVGVLPLAGRIALVERADRAARAFDPRVEKVIASLGEETKRIRIASSAGVLVEDVQPLFSIRVSVIASERGVRREGSAGGGGRLGPEFFDQKPPEYLAREAARKAVTLLGAVEAPAGPMPVLLAPGWPGILLHEAVGHGLEGDFNRKGLTAGGSRRKRQIKRKSAAATRRAFDFDLPAMGLGDGPAKAEPEPVAAALARARGVSAEERFENPLQVLRCNPGSVVGNPDHGKRRP